MADGSVLFFLPFILVLISADIIRAPLGKFGLLEQAKRHWEMEVSKRKGIGATGRPIKPKSISGACGV